MQVEFHIISNHKLLSCNGNPNISSFHYLNTEQLVKSLVSLYELYEINRRSNSNNKNEAEFYSFYVLLHLGSDKNSMVYLWPHRGVAWLSFTVILYLNFNKQLSNIYYRCATGGATFCMVSATGLSNCEDERNVLCPECV